MHYMTTDDKKMCLLEKWCSLVVIKHASDSCGDKIHLLSEYCDYVLRLARAHYYRTNDMMCRGRGREKEREKDSGRSHVVIM